MSKKPNKDIVIQAVDEATEIVMSQLKTQEETSKVMHGLMREWIAAYMNDPRFAMPKALMEANLTQSETAMAMQHTIAQMLATTAADAARRTSEATSMEELRKSADNLRQMMPFFNFRDPR